MATVNVTDLQNAKTDVDHIADFANSLAVEVIDRMGNTKPSLAGIIAALNAEIVVSQSNIQRIAAETAAFNAEQSRAAAEMARQEAQDFSTVYPDTASAIADATLLDGRYFAVPVGTTGSFVRQYRKLGGVAIPGKTTFSSELFSDANGDTYYSIIFGLDSTGIRAPGGIRKSDSTLEFKFVEFFDALITTLRAGTLTTTGAATLATLITSAFNIPTTDLNVMGRRMVWTDVTKLRAVLAWDADDWIRIHSLRAHYLTVLEALDVPSVDTTDVNTLRLNGSPVEAVIAGALPSGPYLAGEVVHFKGYGQSLSNGVGAQPTRDWAKVPHYNAQMMNGGVRPNDGGLRTALVPLVEADFGLLGETASAAAAYAIQYMLETYDDILPANSTHRPLFTQDGEGGKNLIELMDPALYARVDASANAGRSLANAGGLVYAVGPSMINQGENNASIMTPRGTYADLFEQLRVKMEATSRVALGDDSHVERMLIAQTASHLAYFQSPGVPVPPNIPFAQWDLNDTNPNFRIAAPFYPFDYNTVDNIHVPAISQEHYGLYWGVACYYWFYKRRNWRPLQPVDFVKQGQILYMEFNPVGEVDFDFARVVANTNNGFMLYDTLHAPVGITSVEKIGPARLKVVGAGAWSSVEYAAHGTTGKSGKTAGARGNVRDRQGDDLSFNLNGTLYEMYNWCVMFQKAFA